ncbi:hypothetical protein DER46DRAFT_214398 [Fusarium sp. MPI-SDFR-AT-0072]|nr:hypothetical protein DER46DRAFT_214398 [Fusarium sp. MPI-SDFR-AT-0072]
MTRRIVAHFLVCRFTRTASLCLDRVGFHSELGQHLTLLVRCLGAVHPQRSSRLPWSRAFNRLIKQNNLQAPRQVDVFSNQAKLPNLYTIWPQPSWSSDGSSYLPQRLSILFTLCTKGTVIRLEG